MAPRLPLVGLGESLGASAGEGPKGAGPRSWTGPVITDNKTDTRCARDEKNRAHAARGETGLDFHVTFPVIFRPERFPVTLPHTTPGTGEPVVTGKPFLLFGKTVPDPPEQKSIVSADDGVGPHRTEQASQRGPPHAAASADAGARVGDPG